ncbi:MAG: hypothetical protein K5754_05575 [Butyrivibrio sp.]|nr:hypothetical protein [Butyrivibrio sp.]
MDDTKVVFKTSDRLVQKLYDSADAKCRQNIRFFGDRKVLIEGGGYHKVWIETQPMGGAMYGKRDIEVAVGNQKIFMDFQREDGRLPGSVEYRDGKLIPQYDKFQGFCFAEPAIDVFYLMGKDKEYLKQLYEVLRKYDEYLWKNRDSDKDGCLETWCKYDTGEDNAVRYADAPDYWEKDTPPEGYQVVPIASMDFMSYSFSARWALSEIADIMGKGDIAAKHRASAEEVRKKIYEHLWDEERGAFFDRDKNGNIMPCLIHNNLRMMHWNSMDKRCADRFVREHLLNPKEFWTNMPLPSVAVNDPIYRNDSVNNWSGQPQALTFQRAIAALENYGYHSLIPKLGRKLFEAIGDNCVFVQQYDPFTMEPSLVSVAGQQDAYGPAILAVLEYISRMYGVHIARDKVFFGSYAGMEGEYEQIYGDLCYRIEHSGKKSAGYINGHEIFCCEQGARIETDLMGKEIKIYNDL